MPNFVPVDTDPFAQTQPDQTQQSSKQPTLVPVDHDPFAAPSSKKDIDNLQAPINDGDSALSRLAKGTINQITPYFNDKNPNISTAGEAEDILKSGASGLAQGAAGALTGPIDIGTHAVPYMKNAAEYLGTKAANAITGKDTAPDYTSAPPAITPSVMAALNNASQTAAGERVKLAGMLTGPAALDAAPGVAKQSYQSLIDALPDKAASYDPMKVMGGISDAFETAKDKANTFYSFPQQLAEGKSVYAPQIKEHLDSVIADVGADPFHEARTSVGTLQRISDNLPEDGTVPVNDVLDIRKFTNKNFNPNRVTDKSSTYGKLNSVADSALDTARDQIPDFGDALDIADNYWRNGVAQPFLKNKVLKNVGWEPQDSHNLNMVDNGMVDPDLIDETKQKATNLVNKVSDVNSYNAIRRTLPDDVGQAFDAAVLKSMPSNRLQAAAKLFMQPQKIVTSPATALRNASDLISPSRTAEQQGIINAVKGQNTYTPLSEKNDLAQAAFENLVNAHKNSQRYQLALPPSDMITPSPVQPSAETSGQLLLRKPGYNPFSPENIDKLPPPSAEQGPKMNEPVTRPTTPTAQEVLRDTSSPRQLPPPGPIKVPPGGFKRTYNPTDLNAGDEPAAMQTLGDIASGKTSSGQELPGTPETRLFKKINTDFPSTVDEYSQIPDTKGGKVLNTDSARELSPDYLADRTKSADVHEPASQFVKRLYQQKLKEAPGPGEDPTVLFTAGGTGSGKSRAVRGLADSEANEAQIIYDTNMNKYYESKQKIDDALNAGKNVHLTYTYRDPVDALVNGALPRATRQEAAYGSGRTVPLQEHLNTHVGSLNTVKQLAEHYADNPNVAISAFNNSFGAGNAKEIPLDNLPKLDHNGLKESLRSALDEEYKQGRISTKIYQGFLHGENGYASGGQVDPGLTKGAKQTSRRRLSDKLDDNGYANGGKIISHKTFVQLVREHGKAAGVKMSHLKDPTKREKLLKYASRSAKS